MEVLPEEQHELTDDEREKKNEHHFHVHRFVSLVLLVDRFMAYAEAFLRTEFVELERLQRPYASCDSNGNGLDLTLLPRITVLPMKSSSSSIVNEQ